MHLFNNLGIPKAFLASLCVVYLDFGLGLNMNDLYEKIQNTVLSDTVHTLTIKARDGVHTVDRNKILDIKVDKTVGSDQQWQPC